MTVAANLEPDPLARTSVRAVVNRDYLAVLRPLVEDAVASGQFREDCDVEALLSLLLLTLPHLALAPHVQGLDPVMGMATGDLDHAVTTSRRLITTLLHPYRTEQ